jgi:hypothetical protein
MKRDDTIAQRRELMSQLPLTDEIVRGSLIERVIRHRGGCAVCARGEGHPLWVLTVTYPGGRNRQFSLRGDQVDEVRRWLGNYHKLKEGLEAICELNHELLRPDEGEPRRRRRTHD